MRRFVADASHELRTPLATIRGYGELYRMGALTTTDQVDDTMRRIESSATRMGALVEDLLALARMDDGRPMRLAPVDLTVLAADAVSDLHALDPSRPVRLEPLRAGEPGGVCEVLGEESRLRQVLANLVGNAVTHTPAGHGRRDRRRPRRRRRASSRCATTDPASTPSTPRACSSGSTGSTPRAVGTPAAPAWAWRSSRRSSTPTTARSPSSRPPAAGRPCGSRCRRRRLRRADPAAAARRRPTARCPTPPPSQSSVQETGSGRDAQV